MARAAARLRPERRGCITNQYWGVLGRALSATRTARKSALFSDLRTIVFKQAQTMNRLRAQTTANARHRWPQPPIAAQACSCHHSCTPPCLATHLLLLFFHVCLHGGLSLPWMHKHAHATTVALRHALQLTCSLCSSKSVCTVASASHECTSMLTPPQLHSAMPCNSPAPCVLPSLSARWPQPPMAAQACSCNHSCTPPCLATHLLLLFFHVCLHGGLSLPWLHKHAHATTVALRHATCFLCSSTSVCTVASASHGCTSMLMPPQLHSAMPCNSPAPCVLPSLSARWPQPPMAAQACSFNDSCTPPCLATHLLLLFFHVCLHSGLSLPWLDKHAHATTVALRHALQLVCSLCSSTSVCTVASASHGCTSMLMQLHSAMPCN